MTQLDWPVQVTDWTPGDDLRPITPLVLVVDVDVDGESPYLRGLVVEDGVPGLGAVQSGVADLVTAFRSKGVPVVFVEQTGQRAPGRPPELEARPDEYVIRRHRFSSFYGTELDLVLRGLGARTVLLVGGASDVQVHYTAVDAHQYDYHIRIATDLVTGSGPELHDAALRAVKYLQRDALISSRAVRDWLDTLVPATASATPNITKENA